MVWTGKGYILATSCMELVDSGENCLVLHASLLQPAHVGEVMKNDCPAKESKMTVSWSLGVLISLANVKKTMPVGSCHSNLRQ